MKRLPIGVNNFEKMIKGGYYYVDKTMLIKDIVELSGEVKLITRPRRFGKTLNMDMLRRFFSMEEKENLFEGFKIWEEKGIVKDHYHRYPVVFVSFRQVKEPRWESAFSALKEVLSDVAAGYTSLNTPEDLIGKIKEAAKKEADIGTYEGLLRTITRALYEDTGKKAVLLIDEYDVPIEAAYTYRHKDVDYYENTAAFMRGLLTAALKDNPYLEFAVLTGVYRVAKESIFSGLNNLEVFTVFDPAMEDRFGFTEDEVMEILKHYDLSWEDKRAIDQWYGGYRIGSRENLYNPWSIMKYVNERVFRKQSIEDSLQPFWINTSSNDLIKEQIENSPELKSEIDALLEGKEVLTPLNPHISLRELEEDPSGVWTLLASGGYLSVKKYRMGLYSLRLPNEEIRSFFKDVVGLWISRSLKLSRSGFYKSLVLMMTKGEYEEFKEWLERLVINSLSFYDLGDKEPERVYKAFLLGMLSIAVNGYMVESEMESGYGRLDVVVYPKDKTYGSYAAIFEVKKADDEKDLENLAQQALEQIKERRYYVKMREKGCKVIAFGIAFFGKKATVMAEMFDV